MASSSAAAPPEEVEVLNMEEQFLLLDALPVVNTIDVGSMGDKSRGTDRRRVICTMWCCGEHIGSKAASLRQAHSVWRRGLALRQPLVRRVHA